MSTTLVFRILTLPFHMRKVIAKWVLLQLKAAPKRTAHGSCIESMDEVLPQPMHTSDMSPPDSDSIPKVKGPLHRKHLGRSEVFIVTGLELWETSTKKDHWLEYKTYQMLGGSDMIYWNLYWGSVKCNLSNKLWFWNRPTCTELLKCP
jgi:hypothetical protein